MLLCEEITGLSQRAEGITEGKEHEMANYRPPQQRPPSQPPPQLGREKFIEIKITKCINFRCGNKTRGEKKTIVVCAFLYLCLAKESFFL